MSNSIQREEAEKKVQALLLSAQFLIERAREIAIGASLSFDFGPLTFSRDDNPDTETYINWYGSEC